MRSWLANRSPRRRNGDVEIDGKEDPPIRICVTALVAASAAICSTPSAIAASFDGNWSVVAQTTQGHCGTSSSASQ